jgi:predicted ATPase
MKLDADGASDVIDSLRLRRFKNFQDARLTLGPLSVLVGVNATGKSNIHDAFRFLHGIGRGYKLADIFGGEYAGGERVWAGIRGGVREAAFFGSDWFELIVDLRLSAQPVSAPAVTYRIKVSVGEEEEHANLPRVIHESLHYPRLFGGRNTAPGETGFRTNGRRGGSKEHVDVSFLPERGTRGKKVETYATERPVLFQVADEPDANGRHARALSRFVLAQLRGMRFLELSPSQMRIPSQPGQWTLGDRGENVSSVLAAICGDPAKKQVLLAWVRKLTPMDVDDLVFDQDVAGRVLLRLVEKGGPSFSALSASDGTLRFLAMLAAIFGPEPAPWYFIEELENGIHPSRLGTLADLIEHQTQPRGIQIVATSHSPQLLQILNHESLEHAAIVYRLPDDPEGKIKGLLDIREARRVIKEQPVWVLHASSCFEDVLDLMQNGKAESVAGTRPPS